MTGIKASLRRSNIASAVARHFADAERAAEEAALRATDRARSMLTSDIRSTMQASGLGRLGQAFGGTSDLAKGRGVYRIGRGWRASGVVFVRSKSPRTLGTIEAYTEGADIRPVRSRWLWFPSDDIQRVAGAGSKKERLTPGNWVAKGMVQKLGPLVRIKAANGNPLLIVRNVGVSAAGARRSARSLTKRGQPRKGQERVEFIVAFIGIPRTSRAARFDLKAAVQWQIDDLPQLFSQELKKGNNR